MISLITLSIVFVLIAVRQIGKFKFDIWQIMTGGAIIVLFLGQISVKEAFEAISFDVIFFLFGMFVIGQALEESGFLSLISYRFLKKAKSLNHLILLILFSAGLTSAILMNDTLAIIGTPIVLLTAKRYNVSAKVLMLTLAFAITIGSVMSPIGNPQNFLIAVYGNINSPFTEFFKYLFIPTIINLFAAFFLIKIFFKEHFKKKEINSYFKPLLNNNLIKLCKISLNILLILITFKILSIHFNINLDLKLTYIALISALPIILFYNGRIKIIKNIDWTTILFFISMFILMQSFWNTGIFQNLIKNSSFDISSVGFILTSSIILSQLISNVPLTAFYLPLLNNSSNNIGMIALAAGSTIAGNLFILGAASNIIIIQNAEKKSGETLTFFDFAKIGVPLTIINALVYFVMLKIFL